MKTHPDPPLPPVSSPDPLPRFPLPLQNTNGVSAVHVPPTDFICKQIGDVLSDIGADVVKTGMLPTPEVSLRVLVLCMGTGYCTEVLGVKLCGVRAVAVRQASNQPFPSCPLPAACDCRWWRRWLRSCRRVGW